MFPTLFHEKQANKQTEKEHSLLHAQEMNNTMIYPYNLLR